MSAIFVVWREKEMTNCSGVKDVVNAGAVCRRVCCANNKSARELFGSGKWIAVCKIAKPHVWLVCKRICRAVGSGPIEPGQCRRSEERGGGEEGVRRGAFGGGGDQEKK